MNTGFMRHSHIRLWFWMSTVRVRPGTQKETSPKGNVFFLWEDRTRDIAERQCLFLWKDANRDIAERQCLFLWEGQEAPSRKSPASCFLARFLFCLKSTPPILSESSISKTDSSLLLTRYFFVITMKNQWLKFVICCAMQDGVDGIVTGDILDLTTTKVVLRS